MPVGLTRIQILKEIPKMKKGNFDLLCARAGIKKIGQEPTETRPHIKRNIYPLNSVKLIRAVIEAG